MEHLFEFNRELLGELRAESYSTGVSVADLAFERFASMLEGEAEIETADPCVWHGTASGGTFMVKFVHPAKRKLLLPVKYAAKRC